MMSIIQQVYNIIHSQSHIVKYTATLLYCAPSLGRFGHNAGQLFAVDDVH